MKLVIMGTMQPHQIENDSIRFFEWTTQLAKAGIPVTVGYSAEQDVYTMAVEDSQLERALETVCSYPERQMRALAEAFRKWGGALWQGMTPVTVPENVQ